MERIIYLLKMFYIMKDMLIVYSYCLVLDNRAY